ncbi:MAG TPA: enoyl-CoA hydratase/isomerase family protein [Syntrophomonadaceae bacterium]|jgi:enoyl-CoA hydratase/carnithine racemase|nr:enoyl-CoA hydratase/isomerase family protein [Syntrophomonadaceae bacterium]HRX20510.1 enoyl-CoA hydratase/isomerase family protein [Syntrophomonadaceae bacterium]
MAIVEWRKDGTVAILTMNNAENRHNPEWSEAMLNAYEEILADSEIKALVLTSSDPKYFCLGVDTDWLFKTMNEDDWPTLNKWLYQNTKVFTAMLMAPFPTIAAINGHAFGNGFMLAGACDFRFMRADRGFICFPEIDLGIQLAPSMLEWMKRIMPYHIFQRMLLSGEKMGAAEAEKYNIIVKACENAEKTLEEAVAYARTFNKSRATMAEMKRRAYKHVMDKMANEDPVYFDYKPEQVKEGKAPIFMFTFS